jgi:hypothetical protein
VPFIVLFKYGRLRLYLSLTRKAFLNPVEGLVHCAGSLQANDYGKCFKQCHVELLFVKEINREVYCFTKHGLLGLYLSLTRKAFLSPA